MSTEGVSDRGQDVHGASVKYTKSVEFLGTVEKKNLRLRTFSNSKTKKFGFLSESGWKSVY